MSVLLQRLTFVLAMALAIPVVSAAQDAPARPRVIMRGAVQDLEGVPLEGAEIEILGAARRATTQSTGAYRLGNVPEGRYWVVVRRIGFAPLRVTLTFEPGRDREIVFQLDRRPQYLADVEVREGRRWDRRYADFVRRSKSEWGQFLTRDDISRMRPAHLSDVVRRYFPWVSSLALERSPFLLGAWGAEGGYTIAAERYSCPPAVSLNGSPVYGGWTVNDFHPDDVEAIEVYRSRGAVPVGFLTGSGARACGLVVIWLK